MNQACSNSSGAFLHNVFYPFKKLTEIVLKALFCSFKHEFSLKAYEISPNLNVS